MSLLISLRSETLKLKRTLSVYLCLLAAVFGPLMTMLENINVNANTKFNRPWTEHFLDGKEAVAIGLLPWYVILISTLLVQLEYRDKAWKQVLTSPQRLFDVFFAKFLSLQSMIFLFFLLNCIFVCITALITEAANPELFNGEADVLLFIGKNAQLWVLALGLSAIQFWLSLRFRNFIAPVGIGIAGWFMAPMMLFEFKTSLVEYYPYAFTALPQLPPYEGKESTYQWYSLVTAVIFLVIGFLEFRAKRIRS